MFRDNVEYLRKVGERERHEQQAAQIAALSCSIPGSAITTGIKNVVS